MTRRRRRANPWILLGLIMMVGLFIYVDMVVVPTTQPLFVPTRTPTRDPQSFVVDAAGLFAAGKLKAAMDAYQQAIQADPHGDDNFSHRDSPQRPGQLTGW